MTDRAAAAGRGRQLRGRVLGAEVAFSVKSDSELLTTLGKHLRRLRPTAGKAVLVAAPVPDLADEEIDRALALAEAKWFIDRLVRSTASAAPHWTFDLTTRGAEAFDID